MVSLRWMIPWTLVAGLLAATAAMGGETSLADLSTIQVLDLKSAAAIALADNPGIAAAQARVQRAKAQLDQAVAAYWPSLDASAAATRVEVAPNEYDSNLAQARFFDPGIHIDNPDEHYSVGLTASWVLFNGFQRKFNHLAARHGVDQNRAALRDAQRLLLSAVVSAFYGAQLAQENRAIAQADVDFNQRQLKDAQARLEVGTGTLSDVLGFKVRVNDTRASLIVAKRDYETALLSLAALLGLPEGRLPAGLSLAHLETEPSWELAPPETEQLVHIAKERRPDLEQRRLALQQAQARAKAAQADYYPTLRLNGTLDGDRTGDSDFEKDDFGNSVGLNLTYNLFSGGATRARVREAKAVIRETSKDLQDLENSLASKVRSAATVVLAAQEQLRLQRGNTRLVKENRDLVEKEYTAGQGSLVRLNEAQRDLTTARSRLAVARVSLRQSWYDLKAQTGQLVENLTESPKGP